MTPIQAAALYAALNLIILLVLAYNVSRHRQGKKISLGDGGDIATQRACRAHGNAAEFIPGGLIALILLASLGASTLIVHAFGLVFTVARGVHAYGMLSDTMPGRFLGALGTYLVYLAAAAVLLYFALT